MANANQVARPDPWFRTTSPDEAIHLCENAYYPHQLRLLGPSTCFGLTQRVTYAGTGFRPDAATTAHGRRFRDNQTLLDCGTGCPRANPYRHSKTGESRCVTAQ
jgi:hypothetical protein